jgi:predicted nucleotidyltransferase
MESLFRVIYELGKNLERKLTIRNLSALSKVPYTSALRIINSNKNIFIIESQANLKLISLNKENAIVKSYLAIAEKKKADEFLEKHKGLSLIKKQLPKGRYSVILFGSRAREEERQKSDIDLLIIGNEKINFHSTELLLNLKINPIFMNPDEFQEMLKEKEENLGKQVIKNHIILRGEDIFWEAIL